jgi:L-ascorbate metabolism protein UlaG (beta-lactamase superfamily)
MRSIALLLATFSVSLMYGGQAMAQTNLQEDVIPTDSGDLTIRFVGHGTLMFRYGGDVIHVDPVSREADYGTMPKADLILVTHEHGDHLDADAIQAIRHEGTAVVVSKSCSEILENAVVMENGDVATVGGYRVEALPAYNLVHMRGSGRPYHPKGNGNGYVITFGDVRVYVAGDTEDTPEMKALEDIDIAFLPMNLPYTMTPEMVADAARAFRPKILYPYHYGDSDTGELLALMEGVYDIEVRIREMR